MSLYLAVVGQTKGERESSSDMSGFLAPEVRLWYKHYHKIKRFLSTLFPGSFPWLGKRPWERSWFPMLYQTGLHLWLLIISHPRIGSTKYKYMQCCGISVHIAYLLSQLKTKIWVVMSLSVCLYICPCANPIPCKIIIDIGHPCHD